MFRNVDTGKTIYFEQYEGFPLDIEKLRRLIKQTRLISFNGIGYDIPVLSRALTGKTCAEIRAVSDAIIVGGQKWWQVSRSMGFPIVEVDHIDIMEVLPGMGGLKLYGGRLHCPTLQDMPIEHDEHVTPAQHQLIRDYCANDLALTEALYKKMLPQIQLREKMSAEYEIDLRSKSDAQIAETVIKQEVQKLKGKVVVRPEIKPWTRFAYTPPAWVKFVGRPLQQLLRDVSDADFKIDHNGSVVMPEVLAEALIPIGKGVYRMGIGGLHSSEAVQAHFATDQAILVDRDVRSYYPATIINQGLAPAQMGKEFLQVYRGIVKRRLEAKAAGDKVTDDALKICINGSFGKFGSKWSILYAPDLLIQVTITGQLALLMLIEMLEKEGIPIVSANTDGIVIKCPTSKIDEMDLIVEDWETRTGFETEATPYSAIYSRDVNNYLAIKPDGAIKAKGVYSTTAINKNPNNAICVEAAINALQNSDRFGIEDFIRESRDITKFVTVRTVKGGALKDGAYLGKVVRWIYAKGVTGTINYQTNGYIVPRTEGAKPLMTLGEFPDDIDYDWYIAEAEGILKDIGAVA